MASAVFDNSMVKLMTGLVNIQANSTSTYCVLGEHSPVTYKASWATYNNIKRAGGLFEINTVTGAPGYALGGSGVATVVPAVSSAVTGIKTNAPLIFSVTGPLVTQWAIIQHAGVASAVATTNPLLCYLDIGSQSVTNGTLTFTWNTAGIMTLLTTT